MLLVNSLLILADFAFSSVYLVNLATLSGYVVRLFANPAHSVTSSFDLAFSFALVADLTSEITLFLHPVSLITCSFLQSLDDCSWYAK